MFGWLTRRPKPAPKAEPSARPARGTADALTLLASVEGRFRRGGPDSVVLYADNIAKVAGTVAARLETDVGKVCRAEMTSDQLQDALAVLGEIAAKAKPGLDTSIEKTRTAAQGLAGGCLLLAEFYRLRLTQDQTVDRERQNAEEAARRYRQLIVQLAEVADGTRDSTTMI